MVPALPFWKNIVVGHGDGNLLGKKGGGFVGLEPFFDVLPRVIGI